MSNQKREEENERSDGSRVQQQAQRQLIRHGVKISYIFEQNILFTFHLNLINDVPELN